MMYCVIGFRSIKGIKIVNAVLDALKLGFELG